MNGDHSGTANKTHLKQYDEALKKLEITSNLIKDHSKEVIQKQKERDQKMTTIHANVFNFSLYCAFFIFIVKAGQILCVRNRLNYKKLI